MWAKWGYFGKHYLVARWHLKMSLSGIQLSKEKLTCLICASMAGEKALLFVIRKYVKLWGFKHADRLPVEYSTSQIAWMTSISFHSG
jgi:hypothetical protein